MKNRWLFLVAALAPALSFAWGPEGHSIVGELAQRHLSAQASLAIARDILGPGVSIASVSSWADAVARGTRPETRGWHFVDLHLAQTDYDDARDCIYRPRAGPPVKNNCAIAAIEAQAAIVGDRTTTRLDRQDALKFLVHVVGDIHQPMHTVDEGTGGNDVKVHFPCNHRHDGTCSSSPNSNMHAVWDSGILRPPYAFAWGDHANALDAKWGTPGEARQLLEGCADAPRPAVCWALEAHDVARKPGYFASQGAALGEDYVRLVAEDRDRQLARAGLRLAEMLNALLSN